ncbi:MAG: malto-oligosyltrehalose trehalohydrolase, partial [Propionibacterium sp.]|nr:malto-oligosyltrehalose trehalohydrolase [Propionibacterium sp.]
MTTPDLPTRVWAPDAAVMELVTPTVASGTPDPASRIPMTRRDGGWWAGPDLPPGTDYWFSPDGKGPFPDPRSRWQPAGVDGPSRMWSAADHEWVPSPDREVLGSVFYELHVATFTPGGTLTSAIAHLDDLVELGVDVVELMPLAQFSGEFGWGYDGVDLFAVHQAYGGPDALVTFVDAAHRRGLSVCLDVVLNHLGAWGNHLSCFAPYYTQRHHTPWGPGFDLDGPHSHEQRRFLLDVCRNWLVDMHVDALRLDAVHAIHDDSQTHLLAELAEEVSRWEELSGRDLTLIAESDLNDVRMVEVPEAGGLGMDAQWADDVHHALHVAFTGETQGYYADFADPHALRRTLEDVFHHDGTWSSFRGRNWGAPVPRDLDRRRFVVYFQDHDQVGNRARGDRPSQHLADAQLAGAAAVVLLGTFTPMLFQGEEWGTRTPFCFVADQESPERAQMVREGRAAEFGSHGWEGEVPDPTSRATLESSVLDWSERSDPRCARMLRWYRRMISLRGGLSDARSGTRQRLGRLGDALVLVRPGLALALDLRGQALPDGLTPTDP